MFCLGFTYAAHSIEMLTLSGIGIKYCLTEASLGWKCFGECKKVENHTFNDKCNRDFIRKSIKGGTVSALNKYFESKHCGEIPNTMKRHSFEHRP